jgi:hypothetical protein
VHGRLIVDSGTNGILLPSAPYQAMVSAISSMASASAQRNGYASGFAGTDGFFECEEGYNPSEDFPIVSFWFEDSDGTDFSLQLSAQQYMRFVPAEEGRHGSGFVNVLMDSGDGQGVGRQAIFGAPFLEAFYVAFDREHYVLGFAPASERCGNHLQSGAAAAKSWPVYGCTDPTFVEYDSSASAADPSACVTPSVSGCLSPSYSEYNPRATVDTSPTSCCTCNPGGSCPAMDRSCPAWSTLEGGCGADSCRWRGDDECDDGVYCPMGTDCVDCGNCCAAAGGGSGDSGGGGGGGYGDGDVCDHTVFESACGQMSAALPDCYGDCVRAMTPACMNDPQYASLQPVMEGIVGYCSASSGGGGGYGGGGH